MKRAILVIVIIGVAAFWFLSRPNMRLPYEIPDGVPSRGEYVAIEGGCASCHGADYRGGSEYLTSPFGNFVAPNLTPAFYQATKEEFARAVLNGVDQNRKHLYPAFPYSTYETMEAQDVADLYAYISSLPSVNEPPALQPQIPFYAKWRRLIGIWKHLRGAHPPAPDRGAYLVEVLGHCQECHTPRTLWGTLRYSRAYEGGKVYNQNGKVIGKTPSLVSGDITSWSASDIASYLNDGFTPEYDSAGGAMVEVIKNTSKLSPEDRDAIAQYIDNLTP